VTSKKKKKKKKRTVVCKGKVRRAGSQGILHFDFLGVAKENEVPEEPPCQKPHNNQEVG
jgi:hypothetical protein